MSGNQANNKYEFVGNVDLEVDSNKYLWFFRVKDIVLTLPVLLLGIIYIMILNKFFHLNWENHMLLYMIGIIPSFVLYAVLAIQSSLYERKNISVLNEYKYKYDYRKRKKTFEYSNDKIQRESELLEDIRGQLGLVDISKESYELLSDELVKVIQVSCINVTGLPLNDQKKVYDNFEQFNNKLDTRLFPIQITTKTKPISLETYIEDCQKVFENTGDRYDRLFGSSYIKLANDIQKNKKMVSKSPYVCIKRKKSKKENTEEVLEQMAEKLVSDIEDMLPHQYKLNARILNNEEMFTLLHYSVDYATANIIEGQTLNDNETITFSAEENKDFDVYWNHKKQHHII
ncbi:hypothetical protein [Staphylococcus shinii]|uniref:hypothetical protein n=1 Tax=Staphylococcus shinii TaxID=2912228 RepID=UPI003F8794B4